MIIESPLVSVIIPTHNRPELLMDALKSLLSQNYQNWESIVINDGGVDVGEMVNSIDPDGRVRYYSKRTREGPAAARNSGLKKANGKYVVYLDDDDIYYPSHIETLVSFLETNEYDAAYTDAYSVYQEKRNGEYIDRRREIPFSIDYDSSLILVKNLFPTLCIMHKKSCIDEIGLFDESLWTHEDWDLWIRMSRRFKFAHIKKVTCEFTCRKDNTSITGKKRTDFLKTLELIYKRYSAYAENRPKILRSQKETLRSLRQEVDLQYEISPIHLQTKPQTIASRVSVIIPANNGGVRLGRLLRRIQSQKRVQAIEVIVIDSGSKDGSVQMAENFGAKVISIPPEEFNHGATRNLGAVKASGEYLVFTVQDAMPVSDYWLYKMICPFIEYPQLGALSAKQFVKPEADLFSIWVNQRIEELLGYRNDTIYCLGEESKAKNWRFSDSETKRRLTFLDSVSSCIRRSIFKRIQFSPVPNAEDIDYGIKLFKEGIALGYMTSTGVYHWHERGPDFLFKKHYINTKANVYILENELTYFYKTGGIGWDSLARKIANLYYLVDCSTAEIKNDLSNPGGAVLKFIKILKENMEHFKSGTRNQDDHDGRLLGQFLGEVLGEEAFCKVESCDSKGNFLFPDFLDQLGEFTEFLVANYQNLRIEGNDLSSCIYKIFAMTAGEAVGAYYLEAETLRRLTPDLRRIDRLLGKGICY